MSIGADAREDDIVLLGFDWQDAPGTFAAKQIEQAMMGSHIIFIGKYLYLFQLLPRSLGG
jgi:hypothetical protein